MTCRLQKAETLLKGSFVCIEMYQLGTRKLGFFGKYRFKVVKVSKFLDKYLLKIVLIRTEFPALY